MVRVRFWLVIVNSMSSPKKEQERRRTAHIRDYFDEQLPDLPHSLTHLKFGYKFNQPLPELPHGLTHLTLSYNFNQPLPDLPRLTHLKFGYNFNLRLPNLPSLTQLTLGEIFNQQLPDLPSLTQLKLGSGFYQHLPVLTHLTFGVRFWLVIVNSMSYPKKEQERRRTAHIRGLLRRAVARSTT